MKSKVGYAVTALLYHFGKLILLVIATLIASACGPQDSGQGVKAAEDSRKKYKIATLVKVEGIPWFVRMREGVRNFAEETGHEAFLVGPSKADGSLQADMIEKLAAQGVDAICIVPFSVASVESALQKAREKGIVVVAHEATNMKNSDCIIEPFDNPTWGRHFMDSLAECMNARGVYTIIVGGPESKSQAEWSDAAIEHQRELYPDMKLAPERIEDYENSARAFAKTKELLNRYPDLNGILCYTMPSCPAAALAVESLGLERRVCVVGASLVSACKTYLESGALKMISFWDPADAGYAMNVAAVKILDGEKIQQGTDLRANGYTNLKADPTTPNLFFGRGWNDATKANISNYAF